MLRRRRCPSGESATCSQPPAILSEASEAIADASSAGPIVVPPPGSQMELPCSEISHKNGAEAAALSTPASQKSISIMASSESTSVTFHAALSAHRLASGGVPVAVAKSL